MPIAVIDLTVGMTEITNDDMTDRRAWLVGGGGGKWKEVSGSPFSLSGADSGTTLDSIFASGAKDYLVEFGDVRSDTNHQINVTAFVDGAEETGAVYTQQDVAGQDTAWRLGIISFGANEGLSGDLLISNPGETDTGIHTLSGTLTWRVGTSGQHVAQVIGWAVRSAGTFDGLKLTLTAGSFAAGREVRVYER